MLRYSVFRPEGEMTCQPRATLWEPVFQRKRMPCKGAAILGYCDVAVPVKNRILFRPHRARTLVVDVFRGRCPVLICDCPVRGEDPKAQHQNAPARESAMPRAGRCRRSSPVDGSMCGFLAPRTVGTDRSSGEFRPSGRLTDRPLARKAPLHDHHQLDQPRAMRSGKPTSLIRAQV
jgi:hypothetical protein